MSTQQPNNNRVEPTINSSSAMPQESNTTPREVNAHYRTLGVAPDASADDLKAAQTKALYDNGLDDNEKKRIKRAYDEITDYRKNPAAYEAKLAAAAAQQKAEQKAAKPNRLKIGPRGLLAVAAIAIGAAAGTAKFMQSDEDKNKIAADNAAVQEEGRSWFKQKRIEYFGKSESDIAEERATITEKRKAAADFNRIGAYVAMEISDQIAANPAKFLGPQHDDSEAIGLRNIVLRAQKGISEAEKGGMAYKNNGQYLTPNAPSSWGPSRTANVLFDSKTDELKIEVYGADGKLQKETTVGVAKQIELAKQNAAYSNGQVSKPN